MNPVLKLALEISNGNKIFLNRNELFKMEDYEKYPNSKLFNSLYFSKNGIEYRVSNHELPNRRFMQSNQNIGEPMSFYKNNIEVIVKESEFTTNLNFN